MEEYTFSRSTKNNSDLTFPPKLSGHLAELIPNDPVWAVVKDRLVILSDGMMSFFTQNACEVAQHVRISGETGTAEPGALFNQENVPSETLFYSIIHFTPGRGSTYKDKLPADAAMEFSKKVNGQVLQFGGDAGTGLGYCTLQFS